MRQMLSLHILELITTTRPVTRVTAYNNVHACRPPLSWYRFNSTSTSTSDPAEKVAPVLRKGPWSVEETRKFEDYIESNGQMNASWEDINWEEVANSVGTRTVRQCQEKWRKTSHNPLSPTTYTPWTIEEKKILKKAYEVYGNNWSLIERLRLLPGRSASNMMYRFHDCGLEGTEYTNGRFTEEMLRKIQKLLDDSDGKYHHSNGDIKWIILVKDNFPGWSRRTIINEYRRLCVTEVSSRQGPWSEDETKRLWCAVEKYLDKPTMTKVEQWAAITKEVGTRTPSKCRQKWKSLESLQHKATADDDKPSLRARWSHDQTLHLLSLAQKHSLNWPLIAADMASAPEEKNRRFTNVNSCCGRFWRMINLKRGQLEPELDHHLRHCLESLGMTHILSQAKGSGPGKREHQKPMYMLGRRIREADVEGE
ncbi:hypothetical protein SAICODRAFT_31907 [Saitoella complicata NRRL Y-17804]|uniref:Myb-like domain-containing protein n=1 Tax=Saitoella complicata (strain BCRC 22490 / CBS 7301 / JCM 7358 / NBRC 10748 / NRRL Y-17804) TaxID=698492 RepID=A0A0E9NMN8_SAICN|nr:uncharacterized protein SAICODRAFT_31907 [Saitoella complicata NRRL Y-17804]ODQ50360.1 hypothetical protein SAICODRAFT_31907 [Saitoella complicata NRRL Y-17804]GAO51109.1 hypothetical protein G7K_5220-t1 [Saitoella complicata NRRL Y-17804]